MPSAARDLDSNPRNKPRRTNHAGKRRHVNGSGQMERASIHADIRGWRADQAEWRRLRNEVKIATAAQGRISHSRHEIIGRIASSARTPVQFITSKKAIALFSRARSAAAAAPTAGATTSAFAGSEPITAAEPSAISRPICSAGLPIIYTWRPTFCAPKSASPCPRKRRRSSAR